MWLAGSDGMCQTVGIMVPGKDWSKYRAWDENVYQQAHAWHSSWPKAERVGGQLLYSKDAKKLVKGKVNQVHGPVKTQYCTAEGGNTPLPRVEQTILDQNPRSDGSKFTEFTTYQRRPTEAERKEQERVDPAYKNRDQASKDLEEEQEDPMSFHYGTPTNIAPHGDSYPFQPHTRVLSDTEKFYRARNMKL